MRQVEFYMSDGNLSRDGFFKQAILKRNDFGIDLDLLLKCNRLQTLNVTMDLLKSAINKSKLVKISEDGNAVVRVHPLVELAPREVRTILVTGLPRWPSDFPSNEERDELSVVQSNALRDSVANDQPRATPSSTLCKAYWHLTDWIRDTFNEIGEVAYVNIPHYHTSGSFRGFAFVEFKNKRSVKEAVKLLSPKIDEERWFIFPPLQGTLESNSCPESAWKPRSAAKACFAPDQMLARRYVWRCCSRKNKQIQVAFRHLRNAGYKAVNPCDREYDLITIGESSPEARLQYTKDSYGELCRSKIRVFPYSSWLFWKTKFYIWLNLWVVRMQRKTSELAIISEDLTKASEQNTMQDVQTDSRLKNGINFDVLETNKLNLSSVRCELHLPEDFVSNSVVQIYWPSNLVPSTLITHSLDTSDPVNFVQKRTMSFTRRLRISLEQHLLLPGGVLDQVAHVDPSPTQLLLDQVNDAKEPDQNDSETYNYSNDYFPLFVRFKSANAAFQLCNHVSALPTSDIRVCLIKGKSEEAYCRAVMQSRIGASERRRIAQARRRQRSKHSLVPVNDGNSSVQESIQNFQHLTEPRPHQHIIFNE